MHRKSLLSNFFVKQIRSKFDFVACFRSPTEEASVSQGERDRFQFRPHDSTLEQTADSQEKDAGDAAAKDLPKSSPPPKKKVIELDFILVPSSGEPSGSKRHVSLLVLTARIYPSVAPEGESKCLHLGLPSKIELSFSLLILLASLLSGTCQRSARSSLPWRRKTSS
jgi:hypothetical protein